MNKIDKIREKANYKIDVMNVTNEVLKAENEALNIKEDNIILKNKVGLFDKIKWSGMVLSLLSLFSFLVSTFVSVACSYSIIKNMLLFIGLALIIAVCQIIIFVSSKYTSITKNKFSHKYTGLKLMQLSMLFVSLTLNVRFIHECFNSLMMDLIFFPVCFVLDYSTIHFSGMGYDFKNLIFKVSNENLTFFEMLIDNLTFRFKDKVIKTYNLNHGVKDKLVKDNPKPVKDKVIKDNPKIVKDKPVKDSPKIVNMVKDNNKFKPSELNNTVLNVKNYLLNKYNDNECINIKDILNTFKLSEYELKRIRELLKEDNIIYTENKKTYLKPQIKENIK